MRTQALLVCCLAVLVAPPRASGEEALTPAGHRLGGRLELDGDGRVRFLPKTGQPLPLAELHSVRFPPAQLPPPRTGVFHRVLLDDGQQVTGELLGLDGEGLRLRTAWADRLTLPRQAVRGVVQPNGLVVVVDEGFEAEPKGWNLTGSPAISTRQRTSGKRSLRLDAAGQRAEYRLPTAVAEGRLCVNLHLPEKGSGLSWLVEAEFAGPGGPRTVKVQAAGDGWKVEAPLPAEETATVPPRPGWQRLSLRFGPSLVLVGVDGKLLWSGGKGGPGGPLRAVRLSCGGTADGGAATGEAHLDDLIIARRVDEPPRRTPDPTQDEVWLLDGDQAFGNVPCADRHGIDLETPAGKRRLRWADARGLFLRAAARPCRTTEGQHVRIWFSSGAGGEPDRLDGVLRSLDDRHLTLDHADLGAVKLDRARLMRLSGDLFGKRIGLANGLIHLGEKGRKSPGLPPADGPELRRTFRLGAVPKAARLVVAVARFDGARAEVVVNDRMAGRLEKHLDRVDGEPRRVVIPLPAGSLRAGANAVVIRQAQPARGERGRGCAVAGLALEIPR
ncbi:MAG TPA: hypothetical protein VFA26_06055 [Gemmataceae bacterium]|nr:hypothetical protein [Gemmataceae bacterium]